MTPSPHPLYAQLPAYLRTKDAEAGFALQALVTLIGETIDALEDDISQQYANWFIETCAPWVVPYIGDLVGYRPVAETVRPGGCRMGSAALTPRAEVAGTLGFRRRKGTLALLEELAGAVTGWPARAVEFYALLARSQHVAHVRPDRGRTLDLRDGDALDRLGGAFESVAHGIDVRRAAGGRRHGRFNVPAVGLFAWRLHVHSVTHAPACCIESQSSERYTFSILGNDAPLFTDPVREPASDMIAGEANVPAPMRRRALATNPDLNGEGKAFAIYAPDWPTRGAPQPVPAAVIVAANLADWRHRARPGTVLVDPERGRFVFPVRQQPRKGAWVSYHQGFPADMGGGEYHRPLSQPADVLRVAVSAEGRTDADGSKPAASIAEALGVWRAAEPRPRAAVIEIIDSAAYTERLAIALDEGEYLQIRAADRTRPTLRLLDYMAEGPDAFTVSGAAGSRFVLDGLLVTGRGLTVTGPDRNDPDVFARGDLCDVTIRHTTLVPGWGLDCGCDPRRPGEPSIKLVDSAARLRIAHSITGAIQVVADEVRADPTEIVITDSIVDATGDTRPAIAASNLPLAFATLAIARSTVFGLVQVHAVLSAENAIFMAPVRVARRQVGCMRYCYVPPGSRTPRRSSCQPDLAMAVAGVDQDVEAARVRPHFAARRYGNPHYAQLALTCAPEIARGADDEAEMGAFHDLFQPQRAANLAARLTEYTPAASQADLIFAD